MILVDSSVWIDLLGGRVTLQTAMLEKFIRGEQDIGIGDLILIEVLQGTGSERVRATTEQFLGEFLPVQICDHAIAVAAARNYQRLRSRGITVRKTIDTLIATRCILDNLPLLYSDRDFDPFVEHLGLRAAVADLSGVT